MTRGLIILLSTTFWVSCSKDPETTDGRFINYHQLIEHLSCQESNYQLLDDSLIVFVPNIITPDGDGHNDVLFIGTNKVFSELEFTIHASNGTELFRSSDQNLAWPSSSSIPDTSVLLTYRIHGLVDGQDIALNGSFSCLVQPHPVHESYDLVNCHQCEYGSMYDPHSAQLIPSWLDTTMCP